LRDVRIFEFDAEGRLLSRTAAPRAEIGRDGTWTLTDAVRTRWVEAAASSSARQQTLPRLEWRSPGSSRQGG